MYLEMIKMSKIVVIDPGHGGHDPGAVANGLREKDLTLDISKRIKKYIDTNYTGVNVFLTRTTYKYLTLILRAQFANNNNADLFVSIHINAGRGKGFESYVYNKINDTSTTAERRNAVHSAIVKEASVLDRGKKKANFAVLRLTKMSAILTENLFIDRVEDAKKLKDSKFLDKIAKGHAVGIAKAFKLKEKSSKSTSKKTSKKKSTYKGHSIVEYLNSIGVDSSFNNRKKLAKKHGIKNYKGT